MPASPLPPSRRTPLNHDPRMGAPMMSPVRRGDVDVRRAGGARHVQKFAAIPPAVSEDPVTQEMLQTVARALDTIEYPSKQYIRKLVEKLAIQHGNKFPTYRFTERGDLFSPYVTVAVDVSMTFVDPNRGVVSISEFASLERVATRLVRGQQNLMSAQVKYGDIVEFDGEVTDLQELRDLVKRGADTVVLTGRFTLPDGWCAPMEFALRRGKALLPKRRRLEMLRASLRQHDYADAVHNLRTMLVGDRRADFVSGWSMVAGHLRFLAQQLSLLRVMSPSEALDYLERLGLSQEHSAEEWAKIVGNEIQRLALEYLRRSTEYYQAVLQNSGSDILEAIELGN